MSLPREGMKAKKRVTALVFTVILVFIGKYLDKSGTSCKSNIQQVNLIKKKFIPLSLKYLWNIQFFLPSKNFLDNFVTIWINILYEAEVGFLLYSEWKTFHNFSLLESNTNSFALQISYRLRWLGHGLLNDYNSGE